METVTKDGRLPVFNRKINDTKLIEADKILTGIRENDNDAVNEFRKHLGARRGEAIHTTGDDFIFAFAQLTSFAVNNEWEAADRTWTEAIETERTSTFDAPFTYSISPVVGGFARPQTEPGKPDHVAPLVPEGSPYPHFQFKGERVASGKLHKRGGRYDLTFEQIVKDVVGIVPMIPRLLNETLLEAEEYDAWAGLMAFINIPANALAAGETLLEEQVPANSRLTREALALALQQAELREINGRRVKVSSYNLIVPTGMKTQAEFLLNTLSLTALQNTNGLSTQVLSVNGYNPLSKITKVTETDYITGPAWALIPNKGAIRGTDKFYALGQLVGHIGPELRLENVTGNYVGGGAVAPFEGDFETDSAAFRGRIIEGPLGWNPEYAVYSNGTGTA